MATLREEAEAREGRDAVEATAAADKSRLEEKLETRQREAQEASEFVRQLGALLNARPVLFDTLQEVCCVVSPKTASEWKPAQSCGYGILRGICTAVTAGCGTDSTAS